MTIATYIRLALSALVLIVVPIWSDLSTQAAIQDTAKDQFSDNPDQVMGLWWWMGHSGLIGVIIIVLALLAIWLGPLLSLYRHKGE